jgi:hypothetical protein
VGYQVPTVTNEETSMTIAPNPLYPERQAQNFEGQMAPSIPSNKGPLRFEEGIATDTDVPNDFARGAYFDPSFAPSRINHNNPEMVFKRAEDTLAARAHVGSSTWIEAPAMLGDFVQGASSGQTLPQFEQVMNPLTSRQKRPAPTVIRD